MIPAPALSPEALERERPEWRGWLGLVRASLDAAGDDAWHACAVELREPQEHVPLLDGARIVVDARPLRSLVQSLLARAGQATSTRAVRCPDPDAGVLLRAAIAADAGAMDAVAGRLGTDAPALRAVAPLVALPLLLACQRRWAARVPQPWTRGYCPVCGAWPTVAEERGLERERRLRCGRCGADWWGTCLRCVYCDTTDHQRLGQLVPGSGLPTHRVDTCAACGGYLKVLTTLTPTPPASMALLDLATVHLDVAALERGHGRPGALGHPLDVDVTVRPGLARRLWSWTS